MEFEARGSQRFTSDNLISFRLFDDKGRTTGEGMVTALDLSRSGIAIISREPMEAGNKIELTIGMGNDIVEATGVVQNEKKLDDKTYQVGIEFDFLTDEDLNKIAMFFPDILK